MKQRFTALLLALLFPLLLQLGAPAAAWDGEENYPGPSSAPDAPYDGYLFCLKEDTAVLYSLPDSIEPISPEAGIYKADTLDTVYDFLPEAALRYVEPDYIVTLFDNAPAEAYPSRWALGLIGMQSAWDAGLDGSGVRVGILDSGVHREHEDLQDAELLTGYNYLDNNTDTSDEYGHGTFIAGIIAAQHNGKGIAGLAPRAEIVPLKCFGTKTSLTSVLSSAIRESADKFHCDILNLSFGTPVSSRTMENAVQYASEKGVIITAAVGNDGNQTRNYPAAYGCVIGVGSVDSAGAVAAKSQRNDSVWITAPGHNLYGLDAAGTSTYREWSGTSFASPHVAAAIALLLQKYPGLQFDEVRSLLADTAEDKGPPGYDTSYGNGLLSIPGLLSPPNFILNGDRLRIFAPCEAGETMLAAVYNQDGKMLSCSALPDGCRMNGYSTWLLPLPEQGTQVKVFFLSDSRLAPTRAPLAWSR